MLDRELAHFVDVGDLDLRVRENLAETEDAISNAEAELFVNPLPELHDELTLVITEQTRSAHEALVRVARLVEGPGQANARLQAHDHPEGSPVP